MMVEDGQEVAKMIMLSTFVNYKVRISIIKRGREDILHPVWLFDLKGVEPV